jgi:hypothetical protein
VCEEEKTLDEETLVEEVVESAFVEIEPVFEVTAVDEGRMTVVLYVYRFK